MGVRDQVWREAGPKGTSFHPGRSPGAQEETGDSHKTVGQVWAWLIEETT